jgi:RNA polymerase sigma factor (sigma-70 family)
MASGQLHPVLGLIRRLVGAGPGPDPGDRHLLQRFTSQRDEAAFAALVQRHGPMVLGVCRRVLQHPHDAEDAFQATFLVLARKAGSLSRPDALANWLYGVASRTAARMKAEAAGRRMHERQLGDMPSAEAQPNDPESIQELRPVLDEELERLPGKYRAPLVLCYLEGKTYAEAAQVLGWAEGTVSGRLARARELLRGRLTRRGLTLSASAFSTALFESAAPAAVLPALVGTTVKAATLFAAGPAAAGAGVVSARAVAHAEGVLQAMFATKLKTAALLALASCLLLTGAGLLAYHSLASPKDEPPVAQPPAPPGESATAEKWFGAFEKRLKEAKSVFIAYVREVTRKNGRETTHNYYGGTYHWRPGQDFGTVMQHFKQGNEMVGHWSVGPGQHYYSPITRSGFFPWFGVERPQDLFLPPVADFKLVEPKAGIDPPGARIIAYTLYASTMQKTPENARQVTLWLDEKTLAPLKRSVRSGQELEVTERYYGFSTGEVPAPFRGEPVAAFVLRGKLSAKVGADWVATQWLVEKTQYRADEATRLLFGGGAKVTLERGAEFAVNSSFPGYALRVTKGRLSAELGPADTLHLVLGPARLASGPRPNRGAALTATPERVVVEQGAVEFKGVTAEPSSRIHAFSLSGHLLRAGVEYRLAGSKLEGQKERTLPKPDRPK